MEWLKRYSEIGYAVTLLIGVAHKSNYTNYLLLHFSIRALNSDQCCLPDGTARIYFSYHLLLWPGFKLMSIELRDLLKDALPTELPSRN